jgi:hypothetical protein
MDSDDRYNWKDFQPRRRDLAAALAVMIGAALLLGLAGNWDPVAPTGHLPVPYHYHLQRAALPDVGDADAAPDDSGQDDSGQDDSPGVYNSPGD